jgi:hypothetical protein
VGTAKKIQEDSGTWVFIAPVSHLVLTDETNLELKVDRVTFVDVSKVPKVRKRLGFPVTIKEFKKRWPDVLEKFFAESTTYATMRLSGYREEQEEVFLNRVREELSLLTLSQLGYSRRTSQSSPCLSQEAKTGTLSYLMFNITKNSWLQKNVNTYKIRDMRIDKKWIKWQKEFFFISLMDIIRGKTRVSKGWRNDIKRAALLAGQSQQSSELNKSFLWNMIALETLLTKQGDTYTEMLPRRVESFLGWMNSWKSGSYEERIRSIYKKRCDFVHKGDGSTISVEDVLFSDVLILNVLINIVNHPEIFGSKEDLVSFSKKVEAENVLGIKGKVRPKTIRASLPVYLEKDYKNI